MNTPEEFWAHVVKAPGDGCWTWRGAPLGQRVVVRWRAGRNRNPLIAYRLAYELENGPIPVGLYACHNCDNPSCVRPSHIFLGTQRDNMQDAARKGRIRGAVASDAQVAEARRMYAGGQPLRVVAAEFGVSSTTVYRWVRGLRRAVA